MPARPVRHAGCRGWPLGDNHDQNAASACLPQSGQAGHPVNLGARQGDGHIARFTRSDNALTFPAVSSIRDSLFARALWGVVFVVLGVLLVVVAVPMIVFFVVLALAFWVLARLRRALGVAREPNGPLDGRRNVRVITPDQTTDASPRDGIPQDGQTP